MRQPLFAAETVPRCPPPLSPSGFSLLELLAVTLVTTLLLTAGVPGFRHLVLEARMTASVNAMVRDLHLARQAANVRGQDVVLCPGATLAGCPGGVAWSAGWGVVAIASAAADAALLASSPGPAGVAIKSNRAAFKFRPSGRRDTNGTIGFCDDRGATAMRAVVISPTGRPRLASRAEARVRVNCQS